MSANGVRARLGVLREHMREQLIHACLKGQDVQMSLQNADDDAMTYALRLMAWHVKEAARTGEEIIALNGELADGPPA